MIQFNAESYLFFCESLCPKTQYEVARPLTTFSSSLEQEELTAKTLYVQLFSFATRNEIKEGRKSLNLLSGDTAKKTGESDTFETETNPSKITFKNMKCQ